ncbi:MAG: M23 family metallopeptidase [Actinobacteria bacterium]|nr:M23 family metallopeptidase [Actinomycetota bacterium]
MSACSHVKALAAGATLALFVAAASANYVVKEGDTLSGIAAANGTTAQALAGTNQLSNPNLIRVGQELTLPDEAHSVSEPTRSGDTHLVAAGETLASIASGHGTNADVIAGANGITNGTIYVGTLLRIDGEAFLAAPSQNTMTHTVAPGENLSGIAATYGTTTGKLAASNALTDPNLIVTGQVLTIPASGWTCPVAGATYFNDWGFPRSGGRVHNGNDLFAPRGTEVLAPVAGTVEQIVGSIGGIQFRLHGDDGNVYIGSHMDGFDHGGYVKAGTVLGYVGDSGSARGSRPHLHFEILPRGGEEANPYPTLQHYGC